MKLKYQMPEKHHPTHICISHMTVQQVEAVISFLDNQAIKWEYIHTLPIGDDNGHSN